MKSVFYAALLFAAAAAATVSAQQIAFTFDDLPAHGPLPPGQTRLEIATSVLTTLHDQHLPRVYGFINAGKLMEAAADLAVLKAWRTAGQPLGSHTYTHPSLNETSIAAYEANIAQNEPVLSSLMTGGDANNWHWFRYPFLWEGDTLEKRYAIRTYLQQHGYRVAQVSMDFGDYLWNAPYARCVAQNDDKSIDSLRASYLATADEYITVFRDLSHTLYGRDIPYVLLMHLGAFDAKMLPDLIALYRKRGFTFITLEQAMRDPAFREDPDMPLKYGGAFQEQMMAARNLRFPPNSKPYKQLESTCRIAAAKTP